ncbi:MAG: L,D-transpeptidase family protein, partial [Pseudonocardiaceae bacterium]
MPEVALAGMRAGAVAVLGVVALAGATVAGMEKALTADDPPEQAGSVAPGAAAVPPPATPAGGGNAGPVTGTVGGAALPPCAPPVRICVQLSGSSAWLLSADGSAVGPVPIRHGRPDSPTPVGFFPVEAKNAT